ncbi:MAG: DUF58 domain-containing protein [Planctomycetota bacterium]|nr:DUF58 domain-containing protein [Planctomycetota bacterium]
MPNLAPEAYLRPEVIRQVQRFDLKAKFVMEGFLAGLHASPFKGFSVEFSEHRKYVPGDDIRSIDWKVWSRTNRYYVKQYEAETNLTGHLLVDLSASMGYAGPESGGLSKLEYATYLAGAMAYLMIHQQDPVGLVTFGSDLEAYLKPKSKPSHLLSILRVLGEAKPKGPTGLAANLHRIAEMIPHRGLVVLLSDMLDDEEQVLEGLSHLRYRGHDAIVFQIFASAEANFPFEDLTRFEDLEEREAALTAEPASIRAAYLQEVRSFLERYRLECTRRRVDFVPVDTSQSFDRALMAYLTRRCGR